MISWYRESLQKVFKTSVFKNYQQINELPYMEKKRLPLETNKQNIWMEKLTSKGKYKVNVGNHLHTNMISKQAIGE